MFFEDGPLVIQQKKDWAEALVDFETANQYALLTPEGRALGRVVERSGGCTGILLRKVLKSSRPLYLEVFDPAGGSVVELHRPFALWLSSMVVRDEGGRVVGKVQKRFSFLRVHYSLIDADGSSFGSIAGQFFRRRTFSVNLTGHGGGQINKQFQGLSELFTDADTFVVEVDGAGLSGDQQAVLLAAALTVDLDLFES